jgi:hypothetical protein
MRLQPRKERGDLSKFMEPLLFTQGIKAQLRAWRQ